MSTLPPVRLPVKPRFPDPIPGILTTGSINQFAGASGAGKTWVKADWIARLQRGKSILGVPTNKPTGFYYFAGDRPWHPTYVEAFAAAKVDMANLHVYALMDDPTYDPEVLNAKGFRVSAFFRFRVLEKLRPTPGSILFVDPLSPMFISGKGPGSDRAVMVALHAIRQLTQVIPTTLIYDMNVGKPKPGDLYEDPFDRGSGSAAFRAYSDTLFNLSLVDLSDQNGPRDLFWKSRISAGGKLRLEFDKQRRLFVPTTYHEDEARATKDRGEQLLDLLPPDGLVFSEWLVLAMVENHIVTNERMFARDIRKLQHDGRITKDQQGAWRKVVPS